MYRSCPLVQSFARQGLKIRIRRESGPRPARYSPTSSKKKPVRSIKSNTTEAPSPTSPTTSTTTETATSSQTVNTSEQTPLSGNYCSKR
jgi:hypothetical protein